MPHFLVDIRGDAHRAMGLLAKAGVQNVVSRDDPMEQVAARVSSDNPEAAKGRVLSALGGEPFTLAEARLEEPSL